MSKSSGPRSAGTGARTIRAGDGGRGGRKPADKSRAGFGRRGPDVAPPPPPPPAPTPEEAKAEARALASVPHEVRLIGGQWKRSKLPVAVRPGLRPTPDRVRETLFNWLGQDLAGWRVLDAFAGSGALGFEAASRGAAEVMLLDNDAALVSSLNASRLRLGATALQVQRTDALAWMKTCARRYDLVLLDPPFGANLCDAALAAARGCVSADGLVYLEADRAFDAAALAPLGYSLWRDGRAGRVYSHLLRPLAPAVAAGMVRPDAANPGQEPLVTLPATTPTSPT
jgi:16S rRNA (guanine(966)-N(2))-methyltransferase RsmD